MSHKVLIIDDERNLREIIQFDFEQAGWSTVSAENGLEAWEILQSTSDIDCVVSDIVMPTLDGVQLLQKVRQNHSRVAFVFVTGFTTYRASTIFDYGGNALFKKPFSRRQVVDACERLLLSERDRWVKSDRSKIVIQQKLEEPDAVIGLGWGGVCVQSAKIFRREDIVEFSLVNGQLSGVGIIHWVRDGQMGIEFLHLDEKSYQYWESNIDAKNLVAFIPIL